MENENNVNTTIYDIKSIVKELETATGQKAVVDNVFGTDYMLGNVNEDTIINFGFEFVSMSNESGYKTPIYRLGNIEAIFAGQVLHIFNVTR